MYAPKNWMITAVGLAAHSVIARHFDNGKELGSVHELCGLTLAIIGSEKWGDKGAPLFTAGYGVVMLHHSTHHVTLSERDIIVKDRRCR
jgi:hypothetical protein